MNMNVNGLTYWDLSVMLHVNDIATEFLFIYKMFNEIEATRSLRPGYGVSVVPLS